MSRSGKEPKKLDAKKLDTKKLTYSIRDMRTLSREMIKCASSRQHLDDVDTAYNYDRCLRILQGKEVYTDYTPKPAAVSISDSVERVLTDSGGEVDVGLYLSGEPDCYRDFMPTERKTAKLAIITGFAWSVPGGKIQAAGERLAHKIREYEAQGVACEVHYISAVVGDAGILSSTTCIKEASRELDESMLYFFCSALFFRCFFIVYEADRFCRLFDVDELPRAGKVCDLDRAKVDLSTYDEVLNMRLL